MNSICGLNVVEVSCCGLCDLLERIKVGDADSHEHYVTLTLPHVCRLSGTPRRSLRTSEVLCEKFSYLVVIPTFGATVQLFSFFKSREKAIHYKHFELHFTYFFPVARAGKKPSTMNFSTF